MKRRKFIKKSSLGVIGVGIGLTNFASKEAKDQIIGHGDFRYKIDLNWGVLNSQHYPVRDCHEMVQDSQGRIILLTNHTDNNVIIYDKSGKLIKTWGNEFPGAHGLTISDEGGEDFLYITDTELHQVMKTTLDGQIVMKLAYPIEAEEYGNANTYLPTETAVAANGDIYVADGYGEQYIMQYDSNGTLKNVFGGKGTEEFNFGNAHGICIDSRKEEPTLLVTDRMVNKLKRFTLDGEYLESIHLPGAFICRPVIKNKEVYLATIWSGDGSGGTGFVSILDKNNKLVSAPGGTNPIYEKGELKEMRQAFQIFQHPHDVCIDEDDSLYIPQWNASGSYPIKLVRV
ncbi:NHL repeat-containing protein [Ekhidna sp.]